MRFAAGLFAGIVMLAAIPSRAEVHATLESPRDGTVLRGGTRATIAWSADSLPRYAEEWEAFLSTDGGRYFGYRITPHLDLAERRFTFEVPNVESERARILIRAGNEKEEVEIELPVAFAIRQDRSWALAAAPSIIVENERGESARPGDLGVIEWVDGDRSGEHLKIGSALRTGTTLCSTPSANDLTQFAEFSGSPTAHSAPSGAILQTSARSHALRLEPRHRPGRDVLLTCARLNI